MIKRAKATNDNQEEQVEIVTTTGSGAELSAKAFLEGLSSSQMRPYVFSPRIKIDSSSHSRAFPEISLNPDETSHQDELVSNLLHHQFRWYVSLQGEKADDAIDALKVVFPFVPLDEHITSTQSAYMHLLVCSLEYMALKKILGPQRAKGVVSQKTQMAWMYEQAIEKEKEILKAVKKAGLSLVG